MDSPLFFMDDETFLMNGADVLPVLGWREWAGLPMLGIGRILAKVDTGAKSCALNVDWQRVFDKDGIPHVEFAVRTDENAEAIVCVAKIIDQRLVTDSSGRSTERVFIRSVLEIGAWTREVEVNLANRRGLKHAMLIGRSAIAGQWCVNPELSFVQASADLTSCVTESV